MIKRENYNDLHTFCLVAQEKSFSKAARRLGVSAPALSKTIRLLEERLRVQLFTRTTRSVSLTRAGEQLFRAAEQSFGRLDKELAMLEHYRNAPSGLVRINAGLQIIETLLLPKLAHFQSRYPDMVLELTSDNRFIDIVAEGYDAGIRLGADVAEGMIAVKISAEMKMTVAASPAYLEHFGIPKTVRELARHQCICYRTSDGGVFPWEFNVKGETIRIRPQGQWLLNDDYPIRLSAKMGLGIAYLPEELVTKELASGELIPLFGEYVQSLPALYLYYPHRNVSAALRAVIDTLRVE